MENVLKKKISRGGGGRLLWTREYQKKLLSPTEKVPLQNNSQEPVFRKDIKYSRQYTIVLPGILLPRGRNHRKNLLEESAEDEILRTKYTFFYYAINLKAAHLIQFLKN